VEGINNKTAIFYEDLLQHSPDIFFLCETWHTKQPIHSQLKNNFKITEQPATRTSDRGRFKGGYILGIAKNLEKNVNIMNQNNECITIKLEIGNLNNIVTFMYLSPAANSFKDTIKNFLDQHKNGIIIGDLNARVGHYQNYDISDLANNNIKRESKDIKINSRGRELMKILNGTDFKILTGYTESDVEGEFTFCNTNGSSVIDLCI